MEGYTQHVHIGYIWRVKVGVGVGDEGVLLLLALSNFVMLDYFPNKYVFLLL